MAVEGTNGFCSQVASQTGGAGATREAIGSGGDTDLAAVLQQLAETLEELRRVLEQLLEAVQGNDAVTGAIAVQPGAGAQAISEAQAQPAAQGASKLGSAPTFSAPAAEEPVVAPPATLIDGGGATATDAPAATSDPVMAQVRPALAASALGTAVLDQVAAAGGSVAVVSDAQFDRQFLGAGAAYNRISDTIVIPESALDNPDHLALLIVHEGLHHLQEKIGVAGMGSISGPIGDAIRSANAAAKPQTAAEDDQHAEAQAYLIEAMIAEEIGIDDPGFGTDPQTGIVRSYGAILDAIRGSSFYQ